MYAALVIAFVAVTSVAVPTALAENNNIHVGWDNGAKTQVVGPPGISVRPTVVERLTDDEKRILNRLNNNDNIPEPFKTNIVNQITDLFNKLIGMFS